MSLFPVGCRVRFTGRFLVSTGQKTGTAGLSRWMVVECACSLCTSGSFVATNEPLNTSIGYEDLLEAERPKWRHLAIGNIERVGASPRAQDQSDQVPGIALCHLGPKKRSTKSLRTGRPVP